VKYDPNVAQRATEGVLFNERRHTAEMIASLQSRIKVLEDENSALSAHQYLFIDGSVVTGNKHSNPLCLLELYCLAGKSAVLELHWRKSDGKGN
jgi:hypothetical protein